MKTKNLHDYAKMTKQRIVGKGKQVWLSSTAPGTISDMQSDLHTQPGRGKKNQESKTILAVDDVQGNNCRSAVKQSIAHCKLPKSAPTNYTGAIKSQCCHKLVTVTCAWAGH